MAYPLFTIGSPMITSVATSNQSTYASNQTFGFAVSQGLAAGTYMLTLRATSQNQGAYTANVSIIVTPAQ